MARAAGGRWLVRMEDLDRSREVPGAADRILRTLDCFGFEWHGAVEYQSRRIDHYEAALAALRDAGLVFPCTCSRAQLARLARTSDGEAVYPGTCRQAAIRPGIPAALRFRTGHPGRRTHFLDRLQGPVSQDVAAEVGDFIVRRRDGFFAYQLAVVVDDAAQQVTEVVRGCDLLDNTPRQILLQRALGCQTPAYAHLPLLLEPDGGKLSKRSRAVPIEPSRAPELLHETFRLLGHPPPAELLKADVGALWDWVLEQWNPASLAGVRTIHV